MIRDLLISDLVKLEKCAQFPLSNLNGLPKVLEKSIEDEKGLLGSVIVSSTVEISLIFADRSIRDKVKGLKMIEDFLYPQLTNRGFRDMYVFTANPEFAKILSRHFKFELLKPQALVRRT
jgi:hypothetical protein